MSVGQEFVKDLGSAMTGEFDPNLFPTDDALRQGLDPIDIDGLQMLTDPNMDHILSDPSAEAHFRLDWPSDNGSHLTDANDF